MLMVHANRVNRCYKTCEKQTKGWDHTLDYREESPIATGVARRL